MAVAVGVLAADEALDLAGAALELGVRSLDASVDDIGAGATAAAGIILVCGAALAAVRDASETPGGAGLLSVRVDGDYGILLNVLDLNLVSGVLL